MYNKFIVYISGQNNLHTYTKNVYIVDIMYLICIYIAVIQSITQIQRLSDM